MVAAFTWEREILLKNVLIQLHLLFKDTLLLKSYFKREKNKKTMLFFLADP